MNIIDKVRIEGFWGDSDNVIEIRLDKSFNFLVGQNGTGKTTVINLVAAVLMADFDRLDRIQFDRISLKLRSLTDRKKPSIVVIKEPKVDVPYYDICYEIREAASEKPKKFDLDALAEERSYRGVPPRALRDRMVRKKFIDVQKEIESLVRVCWLSVNRHSEEVRPLDDRRYVSAVDYKISSLNNGIVRYFSQLSRRYADHLLEFQKNSFLSILTQEREAALVSMSKEIDVDKERKSLAKVFELLGVETRLYERKLDTHIAKFTNAVKAFEEKGKLTTIDFAAMYNVWKTHSLVQHYEAIEKKKKEIFAPRDLFVEIVNEMFSGRKKIEISEKNEIYVKTNTGRPILLDELSSGEKQLLIILGEALLQEQSSTVYIADEPELSLHVSWQEQLTAAITRLNPNAQIVFATHSPDIVGENSDKVIDMEDVVL